MEQNFKGKDIISIKELNKEEILYILKCAQELKNNPKPNLLSGYIMGSCFFEPSTRTRLSFETAMNRLGGKVVGFANAGITSAKKGETLYDSIKNIGQYVDIIAMRHHLEGTARRATEATSKPILNGGDGTNQHPTQTLLDLFSIKECQGTLNNLNIAIVGDLKYGRTVHSLTQALIHFKPKLHFIAPNFLQIPNYILDELKENGIEYFLHKKIENLLDEVDILYMTRIQAERFSDQAAYEKVKNIYILTSDMIQNVKENMRIMHPLPRVNEIETKIDDTKHAYYFQQAENGLFVRQALLGLLLGKINAPEIKQINCNTPNNYTGVNINNNENEDKQFKVLTIENGTVIDHIATNIAFKLFKILNLAKDKKIVSIGVNFPSQKVGTKNLIKIENKELTEEEVGILAIFAPDATINIIRNFKVYKKFKAVIPKEVIKLLICPNPNCITNNEKMNSHFFINKNNLNAQCKYCEKIFRQNEIKKYKI